MVENPFSPHAPASPNVFVNRDREAGIIFGHVRTVQRGNVAISGPLGIGKTSLLRYIADERVCAQHGVGPPRYAVLYVDVHSVSPFSAIRFWSRTARLLARMPHVGDELEGPIAALLSRPVIDVTDVEEFLDAVADRDRVLVLLLDEFEWALQADTAESESESRNFLAQLASLARRAPRVLSLVVATEDTLVEAVQSIDAWRGSPFPTVFTSIALQPLGADDAEQLFDLALGDGTATDTAEERLLVFRLTGGQPAALQAAAFRLHQNRQQGLDGESLWEPARRAATAALDLLQPRAEASEQPESTELPVAPDPLHAGVVIDTTSGDVFVSGRRIESLTALEYNLLRLLHDSPGRLCSKGEIIRHVWGDGVIDEVDESRVEKLISRLRRKVEAVPSRPQHIRTVRGRGYRFVP